jgi:ribonucleoside-diphosphate reductase alpha chain
VPFPRRHRQQRDTAGSPAGQNLAHYQIIRRNGAVVPFEPNKIAIAMMKAFLAVHGTQGAASASVRETVDVLTQAVIRALVRSRPGGGTFHIEDVQDQVELGLMRGGHHESPAPTCCTASAARRSAPSRRQPKRRSRAAAPRARRGQRVPLDIEGLKALIESRLRRPGRRRQARADLRRDERNLYDGVPLDEVYKASILAARTLIEKDPDYTFVTARLLLHTIFKEVIGREVMPAERAEAYADNFPLFIKKGVDNELLDERLLQYDLKRLGAALKAERDLKFDYLGLQTLYDRYFLHVRKSRIELPQAFFMRVAMGLSLNEIDREARAIEFYEVLSSFDFMSSTPTLFNAGTLRSQLSSCYLTTVPDDLDGIYESIKENALLSKFAGGLGNDWTRVRALGSHIKGTNGESQGVVPFLKVVNDTAVAVNQGGKRKGAVCAYLETWHLDIGRVPGAAQEHRRRPPPHARHEHGQLDPRPVHAPRDGKGRVDAVLALLRARPARQVRRRLREGLRRLRREGRRGEIKPSKTIQATDLWRKMLSMLFETGHPWITFKDACNVRSPQQHAGVVHSSNLCTEITLNTSDTETAVCNLGSVNLLQHLKDGKVDQDKLKKTITTAMRMLDNVIDINYYAVKKARDSNMRHRPVGLGVMGFQDALYELRIPYASQEAVQFADESMEAVCYHAYWASTELAASAASTPATRARCGTRASCRSTRWTCWPKRAAALRRRRPLATLDWDALRKKIATDGMRNSNCVAIAPTATISNIIGVDASIEPCFGNLSVKSNLSGEFTVINHYLVRDLKRLGLWDDVMVMDLKHFDGSLRPIDRVPQDVKALYATAFEVEPVWLVEAAARRQKWIDQAQSLNIYMAGASGKKLDETYKLAWLRGLKTTYYLRTRARRRPRSRRCNRAA